MCTGFFVALRPVYCNEEPLLAQEQPEEIAITLEESELLPVDEQEEFSSQPALPIPQPAILGSGIASEILEPLPARFTCYERYPGNKSISCMQFFASNLLFVQHNRILRRHP